MPVVIEHVTDKWRVPLCIVYVLLLVLAVFLISEMPTAGKMKLFADGTDVQGFLDARDGDLLSESENPNSVVPILDAANSAIDTAVSTSSTSKSSER